MKALELRALVCVRKAPLAGWPSEGHPSGWLTSSPKPSPRFLVSAASKGLRFSVSLLESIFTDDRVSVDSKELANKHTEHSGRPRPEVQTALPRPAVRETAA
jgi:hypothetical protein